MCLPFILLAVRLGACARVSVPIAARGVPRIEVLRAWGERDPALGLALGLSWGQGRAALRRAHGDEHRRHPLLQENW